MALIEKRLHEHFASLSDENDETGTAAATGSADVPIPRDSLPETLDQPFAKVNTVVENSPAEAAGLKPGDLIRNFGYVNFENHDSLRKVAECVQGNEGVSGFLYTCTPHPPRRQVAKLTGLPAKYSGKSFKDRWRNSGSGTSFDIDAAARLGWQRSVGMSYFAGVRHKEIRLTGLDGTASRSKQGSGCWAPDVLGHNGWHYGAVVAPAQAEALISIRSHPPQVA